MLFVLSHVVVGCCAWSSPCRGRAEVSERWSRRLTATGATPAGGRTSETGMLPFERVSYLVAGKDLNLRPSGYEPDELPNASTSRGFEHSTRSGEFAHTFNHIRPIEILKPAIDELSNRPPCEADGRDRATRLPGPTLTISTDVAAEHQRSTRSTVRLTKSVRRQRQQLDNPRARDLE